MTWRDILNIIEGMDEDDKDSQAYLHDSSVDAIVPIKDFVLAEDLFPGPTIWKEEYKEKYILLDYKFQKLEEI